MPGDPPFAEAAFERRGGEWLPAGWGQCRPQAWFEGLNSSTWVLDPAAGAPGPDDRELVALVTESACASGRSADGRIGEPMITYLEHAIVVAFPVQPLGGGQDCPGHPPSRVVVVLREPLGDRQLLDGGVFPFHDPLEPWPPP